MEAKQIALGLGIAIFFVLFVGLVIDLFYESPKYDDFCEEKTRTGPVPELVGKEECDFNYTEYKDLFDSCREKDGVILYDYDDKGCRIPVECSTCNLDYDEVKDRYDRNFFFITIIIATIAIIAGTFLGTEFLSIGFIFGGIFTAIYGMARYFGAMSKLIRLLTVLIVLIILVLVGKKKFVKKGEDDKKEEKKKESKKKR